MAKATLFKHELSRCTFYSDFTHRYDFWEPETPAGYWRPYKRVDGVVSVREVRILSYYDATNTRVEYSWLGLEFAAGSAYRHWLHLQLAELITSDLSEPDFRVNRGPVLKQNDKDCT